MWDDKTIVLTMAVREVRLELLVGFKYIFFVIWTGILANRSVPLFLSPG